MTVPNAVAKVRLTYPGNTGPLALTGGGGALYFLSPSHLSVTLQPAGGDPVSWSYGADYTVSGDGTVGAASLVPVAAQPAGIITVLRQTPCIQQAEWSNADGNPSARFETTSDYGRFLDAEAQEGQSRALSVPAYEGATSQTLPFDRAGKVLGFDADTKAPVASAVTMAELDALQGLIAQSGVPAGTLGAIASTAALLALFGAPVNLADKTAFATAGRNQAGDGGGGIFYYDQGDAATADDGGAVRVDAHGRRFKLSRDSFVNAKIFGAKGDSGSNAGGTDDTLALDNFAKFCRINQCRGVIPNGFYRRTAEWHLRSYRPDGFPWRGFSIMGESGDGVTIVLDYNGAKGVCLNDNIITTDAGHTTTAWNYTSIQQAVFSDFKVRVAPGRWIKQPVRALNLISCKLFNIRIQVDASVTNFNANATDGSGYLNGGAVDWTTLSAFRWSAACQWNSIENVVCEVYARAGDPTVSANLKGTGFDIGYAYRDLQEATGAISNNTFINCFASQFNKGWLVEDSGSTTLLGCTGVQNNYNLVSLANVNAIYDNFWDEGANIKGVTSDGDTVSRSDGTLGDPPIVAYAYDAYTIIRGGYGGSLKLAHTTGLRATGISPVTVEITADVENCAIDIVRNDTTITGAANDCHVRYWDSARHIDVETLGIRPKVERLPSGSEFQTGELPNTNPGHSTYKPTGSGSNCAGMRDEVDGSGVQYRYSWLTGAIGAEAQALVHSFNPTAGLYSVAASLAPATDNAKTCGTASKRWSTFYAATGTINTSDARDKQQVSDLTAAERAVAGRLKALVRRFKFNDAVNAKGEKARWHIGWLAQDVIGAFEAEDLDAFAYGAVCYDEWEATAAVIIVPELRDASGAIVREAVIAHPAQPAGNRYGVRENEIRNLLAAL